jgi:N-formylglutamate amidohydrolase
MTDWYTDRLFDGIVDLGGTLFVNRMSRLVVDPERFPSDSQEIMATKGMGAVYTTTADGRPLRHPLSSDAREKLLDEYFYPYAQAFANVVARIRDQHGRCVILDGHSFSSVPLPYELHQQRERPQICLGTDGFHTPESLVHRVEALCADASMVVERNRPFSGTYVPLKFWRSDDRVTSIMIEIRRDLYMNEQTGVETPGLQPMRELMLRVMQRMETV